MRDDTSLEYGMVRRMSSQATDLNGRGLESAGINRQEAENERFSRERSSDPLGPEFCAGRREAHSEA
jgi:hypothetical protein